MAEGGHESGLRSHGAQGFELGQVAAPALAQALVEQAGQRRVGLGQPAAGGDAVGLVVEAGGEDTRKVGKDRLRHQLRVQGRHTVDGVAHQHRQIGHPHAALARFVHQRYAAQQLGVVAVLLGHAGEETRVHVEDDLQVARQDAAHHLHRPGLQRLVHQRVVGVREDFLRMAPGGVPVEAVFVDQQAQQLGHGQHRVGVVEVDADLLGQLVEVVVGAQVAAQQVLHAGRAEEVFLVQAQLAAGRGGVVGVQNAGNVFGLVLALHGREIAAPVEGRQVDLFGGLGRPQPQRVGGLRAVAGDDGVVGHGQHVVGVYPLGGAVVLAVLHMAAKAHAVGHLGPLEFPGVAVGQPVVGHLHLLPAHDGLAEHAVFITDAVAKAGHTQRGHGVEETRGQPAQTTVAQGRVGFDIGDGGQVHAEVGQRLAHGFAHLQRQQRVGESAANKEFHRQVVHPLHVLLVLRPCGGHPALHQLVAHSQLGGMQPVLGAGCHRVFAHGVDQLVGHGLLEGGHVAVGVVVLEVLQAGGEGQCGHGVRRGDGNRGNSLSRVAAASLW